MTLWSVTLSAVAGLVAFLCYQQLEMTGIGFLGLPYELQTRLPALLGGGLPRVTFDKAENTVKADWNVMYHQGGNSPWIPKVRGIEDDNNIDTPSGCRVDQVHMVGR